MTSCTEASSGPVTGPPHRPGRGHGRVPISTRVDRCNFSTKINSLTSINVLVILRSLCNLEQWFLFLAGCQGPLKDAAVPSPGLPRNSVYNFPMSVQGLPNHKKCTGPRLKVNELE